MRRWMAVAGLLALTALIAPSQLVFAHDLCFADKTPHCLSDPFSDYWEANGGLPVFGYPVSNAASEPNADTGKAYLTQWLERTRLEDHPENAGTPYRVLLGLIGKERLRQLGRDWAAEPRANGPQAGCLWFPETGHNVCNQTANLGFKRFWESNGLKAPGLSAYARSLQLFGLPLTEPKMETNANGDTVLTQWFERARFEWHPNNPDQFKVLLGLLGKEVQGGRQPITPTPTIPIDVMTPTATGTATTTPPDETPAPTRTPTGTLPPTATPAGPCSTPAARTGEHTIQATTTITPIQCPELRR